MQGKSAQTTLEYAMLIAVTVAALLAMQGYLSRANQGRLKQIADGISATHYVFGNTTGETNTTTNSSVLTATTTDLVEDSDGVKWVQTTSNATIEYQVGARKGWEQYGE